MEYESDQLQIRSVPRVQPKQPIGWFTDLQLGLNFNSASTLPQFDPKLRWDLRVGARVEVEMCECPVIELFFTSTLQ
jgi:hypothetical protein